MGSRAGVYPKVDPLRRRYDMNDDPEKEIIDRCPALARALGSLGETIFKAYDAADSSALRQQKAHRWAALTVAVFGTLAVVLAILQLALGSLPFVSSVLVHSTWLGEFVAAGLALLVVLVGLWFALQAGWLLERHKAEVLRGHKFRFLADPDLWCGQYERWREKVRVAVEEVQQIDIDRLKEYALRDTLNQPPSELADCVVETSELDALADYYFAKRIRYQRDYFQKRSKDYFFRERRLRPLPPWLFFLSIVAVFLHFLADLAPATPLMHTLSITFIASAAVLPVLGAGIRSYRQASELARSGSLFQAKAHALDDFGSRLTTVRKDPAKLLHVIHECEAFLRAEHREWLRLVLEADWI